jgi:kynurenine formamidase
MQIIDLSMPVQTHWRWKFNSEQTLDRKKGAPYQSTTFTMSAHAFTHIDSPLHIEPDRLPIDAVPLNNLSANEIIPGDIAVLKTAWDLKHSWRDREYWTEAPYLAEEAAAWLSDQDFHAVGFDFPQDYVTREIPGRHPSVQEMPAHDLILRKGIYQIEYLCNVHQINAKRVTLIALPLKLADCEGAPARVIALLD